jgi:hypothetical protein
MQRAVLLAVVVLALAAPAAQAGGAFGSVFADYTKDGHIDPCRHSAADLRRARDHIPPDIEQYAPDFPEALDAALEARAGGRCDKKPKPAAAAPAPAPPAPPAGSGGPAGATPAAPAAPAPGAPAEPPVPPATPTPAGAPTDNAIARAANGRAPADADAPAPLIGLGVLAALAALAGLAYGLARWRAWEPGWALRARHAAGEASWRVSATWAEFADWLRLGQR